MSFDSQQIAVHEGWAIYITPSGRFVPVKPGEEFKPVASYQGYESLEAAKGYVHKINLATVTAAKLKVNVPVILVLATVSPAEFRAVRGTYRGVSRRDGSPMWKLSKGDVRPKDLLRVHYIYPDTPEHWDHAEKVVQALVAKQAADEALTDLAPGTYGKRSRTGLALDTHVPGEFEVLMHNKVDRVNDAIRRHAAMLGHPLPKDEEGTS